MSFVGKLSPHLEAKRDGRTLFDRDLVWLKRVVEHFHLDGPWFGRGCSVDVGAATASQQHCRDQGERGEASNERAVHRRRPHFELRLLSDPKPCAAGGLWPPSERPAAVLVQWTRAGPWPGPALVQFCRAVPLSYFTTIVPFISTGWTSQRNLYVPASAGAVQSSLPTSRVDDLRDGYHRLWRPVVARERGYAHVVRELPDVGRFERYRRPGVVEIVLGSKECPS